MSGLVTDEIVEKAVSQYWDYLVEETADFARAMGLAMGLRWADKDPEQREAEKLRFAVLLRIAAPMIASQAWMEGARAATGGNHAAEIQKIIDEALEKANPYKEES